MQRRLASLLLGVAITAVVVPPYQAFAQQAEPAPDEAVGDIIVTAQKRSESINRIGVTVAAFGEEQLRNQAISSVSDLARVVPSLVVAPSQANTPVYTLRGVGFYENTLGSYPAVSVYLDEAPLPLPVFTSQVGFDIERIEVLKGPQGTLFGQNSTGGAINYIAAKPSDILEAGIDLSYGRFNDINATAFASGPLTDTLGIRVAGKVADADGWQRSYTRDDKNGRTRTVAGRVILDWRASEDVKFMLTGSVSRDRSDPQASQYIELATQAGPPTPTLLAQQFAPARPRAADWSPDAPPRGDDRQYNLALRGEAGLGEDLLLTSLTTFTHFNRDQNVDPDGLPIEAYSYTTDAEARSFNQELRLSNRMPGTVQWVVGANYERTSFSEENLLYSKDSTTRAYIGEWEITGFDTDQKMRNYAVFGNAEYSVLDSVKVKAGLRYTNIRRETESCTRDVDRGFLAAYFTDLSNALRGAEGLPPIAPIPAGSCINLDNLTRDAQGRTTFLPGPYRGTLKEDNLSWRVGIDYQATPTLLLYANVAKGYKAGGHPAGANATNIQFIPVEQESLMDYEVGFKAQAFDRRVSLTGSAFYYDYRNKQLRTKDKDPIFGLLDAVRNIPQSRMIGAELSITASPVSGLQVYASGTIVDSKIQRFLGYDANANIVDFAGTPIPFAPKYSATVGVDYTVPVSDSLSGFVGINMLSNSGTFSTVGTDQYARIKGYSIFDGRLGVKSPDGRWRFSLWGKNIFNRYYWTNAIIVNDVRVRYAGRPASYGLSVSYRM